MSFSFLRLVTSLLILLLTGCASLAGLTKTGESADTKNTDTTVNTSADTPLVTTAQPTSSTNTADTSTIRHRSRHLPYVPDTATPWWALVANQESDNSTDEPWTIEEARRDTGHDNTITPLAQPESQLENPLKNKDLWHRLRSGFQLGSQEHPLVRPYIEWYAKHQPYLDRVAERARPFLYDIVQEVEARGMPMEIALLPVVESAFQPFAYSSGRAAGIWQFIPSTGKHYGLKQNWWYDGRRDIPRATKAALDYLERLHKRFDGDWLLALASYNSGEGRVARAVKKNKKKGRPTDFWSLDLPKETQGYVPKLLAISAIVQHYKAHGVTLTSIPDKPYLEHVDVGSQIDLALAAELAELPIETMYQLNPAYNRWATDPKGPHTLLLPIHKAETFRTALAKIDKKDRVRWERHRIREGETLGHIARKFQTSVALLQEVNNIRDKWIRAGQSIIIPVATKNLKHYLSEDRRRVALQGTKRNGHKLHHTVKRGDTFWDISRKYNVKVSQLASWNGMSPKDTLKPGQQLVIWTKKPSRADRQFVSLPRSATHQQVHYRVRKGDSLARIAQKFSVTIAKLRQWNSLKKGKYLQPGQRLTLYVDITQQS